MHEQDLVAAFRQLHAESGGRWDGVDAAAWVAEQRGCNDEQQDPADDRHDAVVRLMAERDRLRSEYQGRVSQLEAENARLASDSAYLRERVTALEARG